MLCARCDSVLSDQVVRPETASSRSAHVQTSLYGSHVAAVLQKQPRNSLDPFKSAYRQNTEIKTIEDIARRGVMQVNMHR